MILGLMSTNSPIDVGIESSTSRNEFIINQIRFKLIQARVVFVLFVLRETTAQLCILLQWKKQLNQ